METVAISETSMDRTLVLILEAITSKRVNLIMKGITLRGMTPAGRDTAKVTTKPTKAMETQVDLIEGIEVVVITMRVTLQIEEGLTLAKAMVTTREAIKVTRIQEEEAQITQT